MRTPARKPSPDFPLPYLSAQIQTTTGYKKLWDIAQKIGSRQSRAAEYIVRQELTE